MLVLGNADLLLDEIKTGMQQLMAGSRNFNLSTISRSDLMSLTEDAAKITGIPYVMDAYRDEAEAILDDGHYTPPAAASHGRATSTGVATK